jgi:hypothetical protein
MTMRTRGWLLLLLMPAVCAGAEVCRSAAGSAVSRYVEDAALGKRWAVVVDCAHPGHPASMVPAPEASMAAAKGGTDASGTLKQNTGAAMHSAWQDPGPPQVAAGMKVTLWSRETHVEMRLSGTALAAARTGDTVRVRAGLEGSVLKGVVRGPASVEMLPEPPRWRKE